jgi:hypothetical protein
MNNKEIAYHEAGHAISGFLFYPPVTSCTIVSENGRLGNTISELPFPLFGRFQEKYSSVDYFKIALHSWSGEYFQRTISSQIEEGGLIVDKEIFDFYCNDEKLQKAISLYKKDILDTFFKDEEIHNMVSVVADNLLTKKTLSASDINTMLSGYNIDVIGKINDLVERFHELICNELT